MTPTPASYFDPHPEQASAWADQRDWRILVTRFERGQNFLSTWHAWIRDPQRPTRLHYVGLSQAPFDIAALLAQAQPVPHLRPLATELAAAWNELSPGFHRFTLAGGQVLLTLCVGDLTPLLREQHFLADALVLDARHPIASETAPWSHWTAKALARCCRRATLLSVIGCVEPIGTDLAQCGFELHSQAGPQTRVESGCKRHGQFNPRWTLRAHQAVSNARADHPGTCAVIGAGLAGASVASALARRGWQVQVLDQATEPAAGASGLPVGLVVPHVSVDDCALSRLSRAGIHLMLHEARTLLREGEDWAPSGTLERCLEGDAPLPDIWHPQAAWLKPGQLVRAWLAQPGVSFMGRATVASLRANGAQWELLDSQARVLARADRVVLANACGVVPLLNQLQAGQPALVRTSQKLPALHGVRGQVSWGLHAQTPNADFPPHPVNGAGSVIPSVPFSDGQSTDAAWFVGATYQPDDQPEYEDSHNHAANLARVQQMLPELSRRLAEPFASQRVAAWRGTRCVTSDRLPLLGAVNDADHPELWLCAGMGSRGLSFAVLCAELLAAQWGGEPWVIGARLARSLTALRGTKPAAGLD